MKLKGSRSAIRLGEKQVFTSVPQKAKALRPAKFENKNPTKKGQELPLGCPVSGVIRVCKSSQGDLLADEAHNIPHRQRHIGENSPVSLLPDSPKNVADDATRRLLVFICHAMDVFVPPSIKGGTMVAAGGGCAKAGSTASLTAVMKEHS